MKKHFLKQFLSFFLIIFIAFNLIPLQCFALSEVGLPFKVTINEQEMPIEIDSSGMYNCLVPIGTTEVNLELTHKDYTLIKYDYESDNEEMIFDSKLTSPNSKKIGIVDGIDSSYLITKIGEKDIELKFTESEQIKLNEDTSENNDVITTEKGKEITVYASLYDGRKKGSEVFILPKKSFTIKPGLAKSYGFSTKQLKMHTDEVTMFDVLVQLHASSFGVDSPESEETSLLSSALSIKDSGFITMLMGEEVSSIGILLNGAMPHNNKLDSNNEYLGYTADDAIVHQGDVLEFTFFKDTAAFQDKYVWFEKNGEKINNQTIAAGENLKLTLKGYSPTSFGFKKQEIIEQNTFPISNIQITTIDKDSGVMTEIPGAVTAQDDGTFILNFDTAGKYIISAKGNDYENIIAPWFELTVTEQISQDKILEILESEKNALSFDDIKGANTDIDNVTKKLTLPILTKSGKASISWTSSDTNIIENDGTVKRPLNNTGDKNVTLTATLLYGKEAVTKDFVVTVKALEATGVLENTKNKLTKKLELVEWDKDKLVDTNIITKVKELVKNVNASVTVTNTCKPSVELQDYISDDGKITYGNNEILEKDVTFELVLGDEKTDYVAKVSVPKKAITKAESLQGYWLNFDSFKGENVSIDTVTSNFMLPKESSDDYPTELAWVTDKPEIINISTYAVNNVFEAKVNRPLVGAKDEIVTLTAKITPGLYWSYGMAPVGPMPESASGEKTFKITVQAVTPEEQKQAQNLVDEGIKLFNLDNVIIRHSDKKADLMALTTSINNIPYNWNYVNKLQGYNSRFKVATVTWTSENPGIVKIDSGADISRKEQDQVGDIVLTVSYNGAVATKRFPSKVIGTKVNQEEAKKQEIDVLLKNISDNYCTKDTKWWEANGTWWHATGLNAYIKLNPNSKEALNDDVKQAFVNRAIEEVINKPNNLNVLANTINGLSALGYDTTSLWSVNHTKVDAIKNLKNIKLEDAQKGYYSTIAPYVVMALRQGDYSADSLINENIEYLKKEVSKVNWNIRIDDPVMMMQGLAPYYERADVKKIIDEQLAILSKKQGQNGSFGSANTDAMVIILLAELGINPDKNENFIKNGHTLVDGLLTYKTSENNGFTYGSNDYNDIATYQGYLALIAARNVAKTAKAYNVYDFSNIVKVPAYAKGTIGEPNKPQEPVSDNEINVTFTLKADKGTWIKRTIVKVKEDAKVYHVFTKVLNDNNFKYEGAERNYVSSITNSNGQNLAEFTKGKNSGWLYKVNGKLPNVGLLKYKLNDGDDILWYYTNDWTKDPEAVEVVSGGKGSPAILTEPIKSENVTGSISVEAEVDKNGKVLVNISDKDVLTAIKTVLEKVNKDSVNKDILREVSIQIKADNKVNKIETILPKAAVIELNHKVDTVSIKTPLANLVLDSKTLKGIVENIPGDLKVTVTKVDLEKAIMSNEKIETGKKEAIKNQIGTRPILDFTILAGEKNISKFAGKVTISIPYTLAAKENPNNIVIYYIKDNGSLEMIRDCAYDKKTETVKFTAKHFSSYAIAHNDVNFADTTKHWAKEQIDYLAARNIVKGKSETNFEPNNTITRGEFIQILANMSGTDLNRYGASSFNDVNESAWYSKATAWAESAGVISGTKNADGTVSFNGNANISRQDIAVMLTRYLNNVEKNQLKEIGKQIQFTDNAKIGTYAKESVMMMQKTGIINGINNNDGTYCFAPKNNATRAEVSKMISTLIQNNIL